MHRLNNLYKRITKNLFPIYIGLFFVLLIFFFIKSGILNKKSPIETNTSSGEINNNITGDNNIDTGLDLSGDTEHIVLSDIDIVYDIINNGVLGQDYVVVSLKPQTKKGSEGSAIDSPLLKEQYLPDNKYSVKIPSDIKGGYLYIKTRKELKPIQGAGVYQPITIRTNILDSDNQGIYGRLKTDDTLQVDHQHKEFLYKLNYIPIANSSTTNWMFKKGSTIKIGGFVGDVSGNGIEKIIFVRQR